MKILFLLGSLAILNLISCAEVALTRKCETSESAITLTDLPKEILHHIGICLNNPFLNVGSLNHLTVGVFDSFPIKTVLFERLHLPDFATDDIAYNEKELSLILSLSRFYKFGHFKRFIYNELFYKNKFHVILPNVINYLLRLNQYCVAEILEVAKRKRYDVLFRNEAALFKKYAYLILENFERVQDILTYCRRNPETFEHIRNHLLSTNDSKRLDYLRYWNLAALVSNAPDELFVDFHKSFFESDDFKPVLWHDIVIPESFYPTIYERINKVIPLYSDYYSYLNIIRFGPEDPDIYEELKDSCFSNMQLFLFCQCASLSNKMDLFYKLLPKIESLPKLLSLKYPNGLPQIRFKHLELQKFLLDIRNSLFISETVRQEIYRNTYFVQLISKFYRVFAVDWSKSDLTIRIEFRLPTGSMNRDIQDILIVNLQYENIKELSGFIFKLPSLMTFYNFPAFHKYCLKYFRSFEELVDFLLINDENLNLFAHSEENSDSLRQGFPQFPDINPRLIVKAGNWLKVVDEPVVPIHDIIRFSISDLKHLSQFMANEQFERLEVLLGCSISKLLVAEADYISNRRIFRYIIEKGEALPKGLPEITRILIEIDFPGIKF